MCILDFTGSFTIFNSCRDWNFKRIKKKNTDYIAVLSVKQSVVRNTKIYSISKTSTKATETKQELTHTDRTTCHTFG